MPCPYAERRGALVLCKVTGKTVNPIAYPCLGTKYHACPYYIQKQEQARAEAAAGKAEAKPARPPQAPSAARPAAGHGLLGLTRLGGLPSTCRECIFYIKIRDWCLILGSDLEDPDTPACIR